MKTFHPPIRRTPAYPATAIPAVRPDGAAPDGQADAAFPLADEAIATHVRATLAAADPLAGVAHRAAAVAGTRRVALVARREAIVAGLPLAIEAFRLADPALQLAPRCAEGAAVRAGEVVLQVTGAARAILDGQAAARRELDGLSALASLTAQAIAACPGLVVTTAPANLLGPEARRLARYAVRCGGGMDPLDGRPQVRVTLADRALARDGTAGIVARTRTLAPPEAVIAVECATLDDVDAALEAAADLVVLDAMPPDTMAQAVIRARGRAASEAVADASLEAVCALAATGVTRVALGVPSRPPAVFDLVVQRDDA